MTQQEIQELLTSNRRFTLEDMMRAVQQGVLIKHQVDMLSSDDYIGIKPKEIQKRVEQYIKSLSHKNHKR